MINQKEITIDWLNYVSKTNRNADKILVEKVIRALLLLEGLVAENIPFVFKGGTALMLLLNSTKRLSIDIDIIMSKNDKNLNDKLDALLQKQGFSRKEIQHRSTASSITKEHYKFFYEPIHQYNKAEDFVLLDILFEEINYSNIIEIPIKSTFIPQSGVEILVSVPSFEDILGDKLTAFAPNTTGIPYVKGENSMSMEIIKQLYDIGNLFDMASDLSIIKATFQRFAKTELVYRNLENKTNEAVLDDIFQTSLCIATRGVDGIGDFIQLQNGITRVRNFIFSENYNIDTAILHASKAAYLATLIKFDKNNIEKYSIKMDMNSWVISAPLNTKLNKLKKSNTEAYFYWFRIFEIFGNR
jgi:predicted nucleotidyltransferase component of viral defense system